MELYERSRYVSRIVSGQMRFRINNETFFVRAPDRFQRCLAEELFYEQLEEALASGAYSEAELVEFLAGKYIWVDADDTRLKVLRDNIDNLKVELFEMRIRSYEKIRIRKLLIRMNAEAERLEILRHSYDHLSAIGIATSAKQRYLLGCSIFTAEGPYWNDEESWIKPEPYLDKIIFKINQERLGDFQFRELARTDPWQSLWNIRKHCSKGLFECSAIDLTDEQRNLIVWSSIYESVREHPDNLETEVVEDNDMLDGWMILKRKEKEKNQLKGNDDFTNNEKIRNSSEVFIKVDTPQDAQRILSKNDEEASHIFKQRMDTIKERGNVKEFDMPDTAMRLRQQKMEQFSQHFKK